MLHSAGSVWEHTFGGVHPPVCSGVVSQLRGGGDATQRDEPADGVQYPYFCNGPDTE